MNVLRRKGAAACLQVIDLLKECTEDVSGERTNKGMDQKEKHMQDVEIGGRIGRTLPLTRKCCT